MFVCYVVYLFVLQPSILALVCVPECAEKFHYYFISLSESAKDAADLPVVVCLKEMKISDI